MTHAVMGIDDGGNGGLENRLRLGINLDQAIAYILMVLHQTGSSVGFDAVQIGKQQHIGDARCFLRIKTKLLESILSESFQFFIGICKIHVMPSHLSFPYKRLYHLQRSQQQTRQRSSADRRSK